MVRPQNIANNPHDLKAKQFLKTLDSGTTTTYAYAMASRRTGVSEAKGAIFDPSTLDVWPSTAHSNRSLFTGSERGWGQVHLAAHPAKPERNGRGAS